jgi:hypothetical protein
VIPVTCMVWKRHTPYSVNLLSNYKVHKTYCRICCHDINRVRGGGTELSKQA